MSNYLNKIMSNHVFHSESSEDLSHLYSDKNKDVVKKNDIDDNEDKPTGGFPPIFIINTKDNVTEYTKNRQFVLGKSTVSIKDILKSKK